MFSPSNYWIGQFLLPNTLCKSKKAKAIKLISWKRSLVLEGQPYIRLQTKEEGSDNDHHFDKSIK